MDLSKTFDSMINDRLLAILHAYGCSSNVLELIQNYLSKRNQMGKINSTFSA